MKLFRTACARPGLAPTRLILMAALALAVYGCSMTSQGSAKGSLSSITSGISPSPSPSTSPAPSPSPSVSPGQFVGQLSFSEQTGEISGYASENGSTAVVSVEIYINGPIGTGTLLSTVSANQVLITGGEANGFTYQPAAMYTDSTPRKLYAYMTSQAKPTPTLIGSAGVDYFAGPDAKGLAYFNANLQGTLTTQCASCHASEWGNYYTVRALLGDPTSLSGGTATNNTFYTTASGVNHPGGNQCTGNLCTLLATWWGMDFGK